MESKVGLDDYLSRGGTVAELIGMIEPAEQGLQTIEDAKPKPGAVLGDDPRKYTCTNTGSMYRLLRHFEGRFAWSPSTKWYAWQGDKGRWEEDSEHLVRRALSVELPDVVQGEVEQLVANNVNEKEIGKRRRYLLDTQSNGHQRAVLDMLAPQMLVDWQEFDADLNKLTVANGTLWFEGGEVTLHPHSPADRITRSSPVRYEPNAPRRFWETTLERFLPDPEVRAFLKRFAGSVLVGGGVREQVLPIMFGTGANGKSTFVNGLRTALGDELAIEVDPATLRQDGKSGSAPSPDKMRLRGARYVYAVEATGQLDAQLLKRLTGGEEIVARQLHGKTISFRPNFTLTIIANEEPEFDDTSEGLWRRVKRIPFDVRIPDSERIDALEVQRLFEEEAAGILAWCVEGYKEYHYHGGLNPPGVVEVSSKRMRSDADPVRRWVTEHLRPTEGQYVKPSDAFSTWKEWVREEEPEHEAARKGSTWWKQQVSSVLGTAHDERAYVDGKRVRGWIGYALSAEDEDTEEGAGQRDRKVVPDSVFPGSHTPATRDYTNGTGISGLFVPQGGPGLPKTHSFGGGEGWRRLYRRGAA